MQAPQELVMACLDLQALGMGAKQILHQFMERSHQTQIMAALIPTISQAISKIL